MLGPGILIGIGLGGLFDGIVLHQILQWHHMLSTPTPPVTVEAIQLNTLADGLFHAVAWFATAAGVAWLALATRAGRAPSPVRLLGAALVGWGAFNLVEGLVDHYLLGLHHVREGADAGLYDAAFLAWGALMVGLGAVLSRRTSGAPEPRRGSGARTLRAGR